jgi:hypothetical protein
MVPIYKATLNKLIITFISLEIKQTQFLWFFFFFLLGLARDLTGSYIVSFYVMGVGILIGSVCIFWNCSDSVVCFSSSSKLLFKK